LITVVKKWLREKDYGFLENGEGPDIMVRKSDLQNCQFLKVGAKVEFECHPEKSGLVAKKVKLQKAPGGKNKGNGNGGNNGRDNRGNKPFRFGVMQ